MIVCICTIAGNSGLMPQILLHECHSWTSGLESDSAALQTTQSLKMSSWVVSLQCDLQLN